MSAPAGQPGDTAVEIVVVDYGMGNRRSVEKALAHVGARPRISSDARVIAAAAGLVVPGVGAFPRAMDNLARLGLVELLRERVAAGVPVLGICLGMQLAFESSSELGGADGLGLLAGAVASLQADGRKLPHIGWNEVSFRAAPASPLLRGLPERCAFYHVHSYAARPANNAEVLGSAEYGETFATAVASGSFYGVQFHPEKSSAAGLRLLGNFAAICAAAVPDRLGSAA
jgi:imidazole glycerol-phosphate synthase subunit HisH